MMIIYIVAIFNFIVIQKTVVAEVPSTCVPSLTRPGRPLPCSSNLDCECFNLATNNTGICAAALISCTSLNNCDLNNQTCSIPNTVCVVGSRCNQPVCYPLALASPEICPQISTVPSTTTSSSMITTPYQIKTTYPILGVFDTVIISGNKFFIKFIQLTGQSSSSYLEILNTTNAVSPISMNNMNLTLSNLNNANVIVYFKTLKQVIYNDILNTIATIDIENLSPTNITLGTMQQVNITATNDLNVFSGCCGTTNVSSLGTVNVTSTTGGWPNITAIGENVNVQILGGGVPKIFMTAKDTANIFTGGIPTCYIEAGNLINITTTGISTIYGKASTSTMSANMILDGISTVYMGVSDTNGTRTGYSCPQTVNMKLGAASTVYVCATGKINVNGYGGTVYYHGAINDTRTYGNEIPF